MSRSLPLSLFPSDRGPASQSDWLAKPNPTRSIGGEVGEYLTSPITLTLIDQPVEPTGWPNPLLLGEER